jgi:hypothetical protein
MCWHNLSNANWADSGSSLAEAEHVETFQASHNSFTFKQFKFVILVFFAFHFKYLKTKKTFLFPEHFLCKSEKSRNVESDSRTNMNLRCQKGNLYTKIAIN